MRRISWLLPSLLLAIHVGCPGGDDDAADDDAGDDDAGDDDTVGEVDQAPITFVLVNESGEPRYLFWFAQSGPTAHWVLRCSVDIDGGGQSCEFELPFGEVRCLPGLEGQHCQGVYGDEAAYVLPPGASLEIEWNGRLWEPDPDFCSSGICYREVLPREASYTATIKVFEGWYCFKGNCEEPGEEGGLIWGALPTGDWSYAHVTFGVPYGKPSLTLPLD